MIFPRGGRENLDRLPDYEESRPEESNESSVKKRPEETEVPVGRRAGPYLGDNPTQ